MLKFQILKTVATVLFSLVVFITKYFRTHTTSTSVASNPSAANDESQSKMADTTAVFNKTVGGLSMGVEHTKQGRGSGGDGDSGGVGGGRCRYGEGGSGASRGGGEDQQFNTSHQDC